MSRNHGTIEPYRLYLFSVAKRMAGRSGGQDGVDGRGATDDREVVLHGVAHGKLGDTMKLQDMLRAVRSNGVVIAYLIAIALVLRPDGKRFFEDITLLLLFFYLRGCRGCRRVYTSL